MVADHRDDIVQHDDLPDALHAFALESSTLTTLPPWTGESVTLANFTPGGSTSMPYCDGAVDLAGGVQPLQRLADQGEVLHRLQRRIFRRRLLSRRRRPSAP